MKKKIIIGVVVAILLAIVIAAGVILPMLAKFKRAAVEEMSKRQQIEEKVIDKSSDVEPAETVTPVP